MSESGDYNPGPWKGHDFSSARASYDVHAGRSYDDAVKVGKITKDLIPDRISTDSTSPLIIVIDETGSMGDWPATIFSKLPYLENEGKEYLGEDFEICFMAVGDAYCNEKYPLQVRPFAKGVELKTRLNELIIEGGGGGQQTETYEFAALYANERIDIPKAVKPIMIFIGDEEPYNTIDRSIADKLMGYKVEKTLTTKEVFEKLKEKFSVYLIRKSYGTSSGNTMSSDDKKITRTWSNYLGEDHISNLPSADRVVDVIFGILANETGRIAYFEHELEDRQLKDVDGDKKVDMVYKSLNTIHRTDSKIRDVKLIGKGKSVMRNSVSRTDSKTVKPLL